MLETFNSLNHGVSVRIFSQKKMHSILNFAFAETKNKTSMESNQLGCSTAMRDNWKLMGPMLLN